VDYLPQIGSRWETRRSRITVSPRTSQETSGYRHRLGGGVGDWLLTNEFTRWDESGDRTPSLSCFVVGTLAMGDLRATCILGIDCGYP